jgi:hypothetical protein
MGMQKAEDMIMNKAISQSPPNTLTGTLVIVLFLAASAVAQPEALDAFRVQLWNPDHPVDILTYNPNHEKLELPKPMDIPKLSDVHGRGFTEASLTKDVLVGGNITISIDYQDSSGEGFYDATLGASRRTAFSAALTIWASLLQGPATITVAATMTPRGGTAHSATLASSGPVDWWFGITNAPVADTWYPSALAEIISGSDPDPDAAEITVDFNSDVDDPVVLGSMDWYYGTDANPGSDIDFMMVTLHEMCHGFGMVSSFKSDGSWGWTHSGTKYPNTYDRFLVDTTGTQLITLPVSASHVTGDNVFWNGAIANWAYIHDFHGAGLVRIYAPSPWDGGSSMSHIDETTFSNSIWELITPEYDGDVVCIHDPDLICLGIFQDIGHSLSRSRYVNLGASGYEDGSSGNPFNSISEGVADVPTNGHLRIFTGSYSGARTITKAMTLHGCTGVTILGTSKAGGSVLSSDSVSSSKAVPPVEKK